MWECSSKCKLVLGKNLMIIYMLIIPWVPTVLLGIRITCNWFGAKIQILWIKHGEYKKISRKWKSYSNLSFRSLTFPCVSYLPPKHLNGWIILSVRKQIIVFFCPDFIFFQLIFSEILIDYCHYVVVHSLCQAVAFKMYSCEDTFWITYSYTM